MFGGSTAGQRAELHLDEGQALGLLQHLNNEELRRLLDSEDKLLDLINDLPQVKNLGTEKEMLETSNRSLAEFNLSRAPRLTAATQRLAETHGVLRELRAEADTEKAKLGEREAPQSLDTILALLQTSAAQADEKCEELANNFLSGSLTIDDFLDTFVKQKVEANLKAVKCDKLRELLQAGRGSSGY